MEEDKGDSFSLTTTAMTKQTLLFEFAFLLPLHASSASKKRCKQANV